MNIFIVLCNQLIVSFQKLVSIMPTPSTKAAASGAKSTPATKTAQKPASGAGAKVKTNKTSSNGKKVINSHSNRPLGTGGLMRFSQGRMFHRRALYRISKWKSEQEKLKTDKTKKTAGSIRKKKDRALALKKKTIGGDRNGKERLVRTKRFVRIRINSRE